METCGSKLRRHKMSSYFTSILSNIKGLVQVIESRDRSHDDPAGPSSVQSCDAVRVSVLVSAWSN